MSKHFQRTIGHIRAATNTIWHHDFFLQKISSTLLCSSCIRPLVYPSELAQYTPCNETNKTILIVVSSMWFFPDIFCRVGAPYVCSRYLTVPIKIPASYCWPQVYNAVWASCQIRKIAGCACVGNVGSVFDATVRSRSRHASRHVRHARAVVHVGIAN